MPSHPLYLPTDGRVWSVLHVRPRCEKKLADYCLTQGVASYLPLRKRLHKYGARERTFYSPLFPGYVFCLSLPDAAANITQNRYVANHLDVLDQEGLVRQLRQIQKALEIGHDIEVMPCIQEGKVVSVVSGPLKGLEGVVCRIKGKTKVVINVEMIDRAIAVEVEAAMLGPA